MKPTSDKPKHQRTRPIHPLQVVDDHQQRFFEAACTSNDNPALHTTS
jgi:hypothetical protein